MKRKRKNLRNNNDHNNATTINSSSSASSFDSEEEKVEMEKKVEKPKDASSPFNLPRELQQLYKESSNILSDFKAEFGVRSTRGAVTAAAGNGGGGGVTRKNYTEYDDDSDLDSDNDFQNSAFSSRRRRNLRQSSSASAQRRYRFRRHFSDDDDDDDRLVNGDDDDLLDEFVHSSQHRRKKSSHATSSATATLDRNNAASRVTRRTTQLLKMQQQEQQQEQEQDNNDPPSSNNVSESPFLQDSTTGTATRAKRRLVRATEIINQNNNENHQAAAANSKSSNDLHHDLHVNRQYSLRERQKIDYVVRIPLYGASPPPKKNERRTTRPSNAPGYLGRFSHFANSGLGRFRGAEAAPRFLNQDNGAESDDADYSPGKDVRRLAGLSSDLKPLNSTSSSNRGEDSDRIILGLTDCDPVEIDGSVDFSAVGGLSEHVRSLKEMVLLPLLYPEMFERFSLSPPRGVLFHGPPGTGKTLIARALANVCSSHLASSQKVTFFMRKGADVLSKWVGESERQLKELFHQAKLLQPSIIFFDEIDGLAPVRSSKQDQIHASIVTTLLALMDGLDTRGQVVVVGATNRLDSIDPALRRPGRFDREMFFPLPNREARREIINIHTRKWEPKPEVALLEFLADNTQGYGGSDLKSLCTEAALKALDRTFPEVYESELKLQIDLNRVRISKDDFSSCLRKIVPSSYRWKDIQARPIQPHLKPLLDQTFLECLTHLERAFPFLNRFQNSLASNYAIVHRPRLHITSPLPNNGQLQISTAILNECEGLSTSVLNISCLYADSSISAEMALVQFLREAKRRMPSVVFIPDLEGVWRSLTASLERILRDFLVHQLASTDALLIIASSCGGADGLDGEEECEAFSFFPEESRVAIGAFSSSQIRLFIEGAVRDLLTFENVGVTFDEDSAEWKCHKELFLSSVEPETVKSKTPTSKVVIPAAPLPPRKLTLEELTTLHEHDMSIFRRLRMLFRDFLMDLIRCKDYKALCKGLNAMEDYPEELKFDFHELLDRVEAMLYLTVGGLKRDIMETLDGFGVLASQRQEFYRLTYIYSLADYIEEWFLSVDRGFVQEAIESAAREKRLKKEYEQLAATKEPVNSAAYRLKRRVHLRQDSGGANDPGAETGGGETDGNEETRVSRRLRGEGPAFDSEALNLVQARKHRLDAGPSAASSGTDRETAAEPDEEVVINSGPGVDEVADEHEEVAELENEILNLDAAENDAKTKDVVMEQRQQPEQQVEPEQDTDTLPTVIEEVEDSAVMTTYPTPDAEPVRTIINLYWVKPVNVTTLAQQLALKCTGKSLDALEQVRSDLSRVILDWKKQIIDSIKQHISDVDFAMHQEIDLTTMVSNQVEAKMQQ